MALVAGTRLGPYEITAPIGAGGMGEVYEAMDTNLGRRVAIKVLPDAVATDVERLARFEREAKTLAALNHPNIATIHGLEKTDGILALVMELVEGPTLADRIAQGSIPIDEALRIAEQIAEALEAAHERGIIHRDLKPANVKLRPDGTVKVLDFGLAKVLEFPTGSPSSIATSPTITASAYTLSGVILGTAAYMSPEQARGRPVDRRTDVWAFGCLTYEMLIGARAFPGDTFTDIVATIVGNEPDWSALPADTPVAIQLMLRRCLQKDVGRRLQHIGDARIEIQDARTASSVAHVESGQPASRWRRAVPWAVTVIAIGLALASMLRDSDTPAERSASRLELNLPPGVDLDASVGGSIALSPDGTQVAFVGVFAGTRQIYVRRLDQFEAVPLRGTEQATSCFFAPDGLKVAFVLASGALKIVSLSDSAVATLATDVNYVSGATWGPDDLITFARKATLWQVPASGGVARELMTLDPAKRELSQSWPTIVAGGKALLFVSTTAEGSGQHIEALSLADKRRRVVVDVGTFPLYSSSGHLIYFRDGVLFAVPFDADRLEVTGSPVRVVENLAATAGVPLVTLSSSGSLAFAPNAGASSRLVWVSRQGAERTINDIPRGYRHPRVSPDGRRLVVQASGDLWMQDLVRGTFARLTSLGTVDGFITWADGAHVIFRTTTAMRIVDVDGGGRSEVIPGTTAADYPNSVHDGTLAFVKMAATGDLHALSLAGTREPFALLETPAYEAGAQFSPNGQWLAYVSDESGPLQVYLRPFPSLDRKWQVSTEGGTQVLWNRNGRELFYRTGTKIMAVAVSTAPRLTLSAPRLVFEGRYVVGTITFANYDVAPDGERFVMLRDESGSGRLNIVLNWAAELQRLRPPSTP